MKRYVQEVREREKVGSATERKNLISSCWRAARFLGEQLEAIGTLDWRWLVAVHRA